MNRMIAFLSLPLYCNNPASKKEIQHLTGQKRQRPIVVVSVVRLPIVADLVSSSFDTAWSRSRSGRSGLRSLPWRNTVWAHA